MQTTILKSTTGRKLRIRTYSPTGDLGRAMQRAADLQARIALLDAELRLLRERFLSHMEKHKIDRIESSDFRVTRKTRHAWRYSASTEREMQALRHLQHWEQSEGIATDNPTVYVALSTITPESDR